MYASGLEGGWLLVRKFGGWGLCFVPGVVWPLGRVGGQTGGCCGRVALRMVATQAEEGVRAEGRRLTEVTFGNRFVEELPKDPEARNFVRRVSGAAYSLVNPTPPWKDDQSESLGQKKSSSMGSIKLAAWSKSCAELLELHPEDEKSPQVVSVLAGAEILPSMKPYAQCYGGHQFGNWAEQLGDGRAISLGDIINSKTGQRWELQLKGAGKTPYSRFADGRAVTRSSVREFLCSEAMFHLGIPTTRALSLVLTGAGVVRDQFYDGNAQVEPGAVVCRVAQTFVRFGTFQLPASRGDMKLLKEIADFTVRDSFPEFASVTDDFDAEENRYVLMLREVVRRTASMIADWQSVGFVHGVCNTDNFSILGLTIDYGPYGFLDAYDPMYTPNTTDLPGRRYCYARQPSIGLWNLLQFAQSLVSLTGVAPAEAELERFRDVFGEETDKRMQRKFGFVSWQESDNDITVSVLKLLAEDKVDHTNFWRSLSSVQSALQDEEDVTEVLAPLADVLKGIKDEERRKLWAAWVKQYAKRVAEDKDVSGKVRSDAERAEAMNKVNPKYILRNYLAQNAIEKAERGDYSEVQKLLSLLERPFDEQPDMDIYASEAPSWASRPGVCVNSCSS